MDCTIPLYSLYGQIDTAAELRFVHLESLESRNRIYNWHIRPHRHHDLYQLIWVERGSGTVMLDRQELSLRSPVLISIPPPVVHGFQWVPGTEGLILTIAQSFVADLLSQSSEPSVHAISDQLLTITGGVEADRVSRLRNLFGTILDEYTHDRVCRSTAIAGNVLMLFAEVARLRHLSLQNSGSIDAGGQVIYRRFKELIEAHFRQRWSVADYAQAMDMTERSMRRLCMNLVGLSPVQVIQRRVLLEAQRNLLYTDMTVAAIGYELSFEDPAYFSRFFSRNEGVTPMEYRKMHRERLQ